MGTIFNTIINYNHYQSVIKLMSRCTHCGHIVTPIFYRLNGITYVDYFLCEGCGTKVMTDGDTKAQVL